jgi:hypothetical protein
MRSRRLLVTCLLLPAIGGCDRWTSADPAEPGGKAIEWKLDHELTFENPVATITGPTGASTTKAYRIDYTPPTPKLVERTGGNAAVLVRVEHGTVAIRSDRPGMSPSAHMARSIVVEVENGGGWTITGKCFDPAVALPLNISRGDTTASILVSCTVNFDYGWNNRVVSFLVEGDGDVRLQPNSEGRATIAVAPG